MSDTSNDMEFWASECEEWLASREAKNLMTKGQKMIFQNIRDANGSNIMATMTLTEFKGQKVNAKGKPMQSWTLTDSTGEKHSVTIHQGNKGLVPTDRLGQTGLFSLSTYQGQNGVAYSGFYEGPGSGQQPAAPQTAQNAPQSTPAPQKAGDMVGAQIIRQNALAHATDLLIASTPRATLEQWDASQLAGNTIAIATLLAEWAATGKTAATSDEPNF